MTVIACNENVCIIGLYRGYGILLTWSDVFLLGLYRGYGILLTWSDVFLHLLFFHDVLILDNNQLQLLPDTLWRRIVSCLRALMIFSTCCFSTDF
jgi:hypothetical protein